MVPASLAAMVMFQMRAELDVLRRLALLEDVTIEKSILLTEPHAQPVDHTPELKETTLSASQINAMATRSSPG
jgi:hypothetical protein